MSFISTFRSVVGLTCPKCQKHKMFYTSTMSYKRPFDMKDNCSYCGQKFELEPGFFYGAMFIGYVMSGFAFLGIFAIAKFALGFSLWWSMGIMIAVSMITFIYQFRVARSVWVHLWINFDPKARNVLQNDVTAP